MYSKFHRAIVNDTAPLHLYCMYVTIPKKRSVNTSVYRDFEVCMIISMLLVASCILCSLLCFYTVSKVQIESNASKSNSSPFLNKQHECFLSTNSAICAKLENLG